MVRGGVINGIGWRGIDGSFYSRYLGLERSFGGGKLGQGREAPR